MQCVTVFINIIGDKKAVWVFFLIRSVFNVWTYVNHNQGQRKYLIYYIYFWIEYLSSLFFNVVITSLQVEQGLILPHPHCQ